MKTVFSICLTVIGFFIVAPKGLQPEILTAKRYEAVNPVKNDTNVEAARYRIEVLKIEVAQLQKDIINGIY